MDVIQVKKCKGCLFFDDGNDGHCVRHRCAHPKADSRGINVYRCDYDGWNAKGGSPDWCPLKRESLIVQFIVADKRIYRKNNVEGNHGTKI